MAIIYPTYEDVETVRLTLPSILAEARQSGAALIVHDASVTRTAEMRDYLTETCSTDAFLILTSPMSMGEARNLCLEAAISLFAPSHICMLEDDHGLHPGAVPSLLAAAREHYGRPAPNGLAFGLFSGCLQCWGHLHAFQTLEGTRHLFPASDNPIHALGGANSCFRCAPTSHWQSVLKGYDTDEYMISNWQTRNINFRNYYRGFTSLYVEGGELAFAVDREGQGYTQTPALRRWDETYTASDPRSRYAGKPAAADSI